MRALESRICPVCGERFAPASARQIYCGKECNRRAYNRRRSEKNRGEKPRLIEKICPVCGRTFLCENPRQIYCGKECSRTAIKMRYQKGPRPIKAKVCPVCGGEFLPKTPNQKLCSDECRRESARISQQKSRYGEMQLRVCPVCGKEFLVTRRQYSKVYCSDRCRDEVKRGDRAEAYRARVAKGYAAGQAAGACTDLPAKEAGAADESPATAESAAKAHTGAEGSANGESSATAEPPAAPNPAAQGPAPAFGHRRRTMEELIRLNIEAVKRGMSYGQYIAQLKRGER